MFAKMTRRTSTMIENTTTDDHIVRLEEAFDAQGTLEACC